MTLTVGVYFLEDLEYQLIQSLLILYDTSQRRYHTTLMLKEQANIVPLKGYPRLILLFSAIETRGTILRVLYSAVP